MSDTVINGYASYYQNYATTSASTSSLEQTLSTDLSSATDDELMDVCKEFESYFVEQVFKSMEKMIPEDEDDDEDSSMSSMMDYYKEEMISQYASLATESNGGTGLGIAQTLYEQMKRNINGSDVPTVDSMVTQAAQNGTMENEDS
jgi:flagellar protein FlgJ